MSSVFHKVFLSLSMLVCPRSIPTLGYNGVCSLSELCRLHIGVAQNAGNGKSGSAIEVRYQIQSNMYCILDCMLDCLRPL